MPECLGTPHRPRGTSSAPPALAPALHSAQRALHGAPPPSPLRLPTRALTCARTRAPPHAAARRRRAASEGDLASPLRARIEPRRLKQRLPHQVFFEPPVGLDPRARARARARGAAGACRYRAVVRRLDVLRRPAARPPSAARPRGNGRNGSKGDCAGMAPREGPRRSGRRAARGRRGCASGRGCGPSTRAPAPLQRRTRRVRLVQGEGRDVPA